VSISSIPVDVLNPGQVFAALGFLEAANTLCSRAWGGFDWANGANVRFVLEADGGHNPFEIVLGFLAGAELRRMAPPGYEDPPPKKSKKKAAGGDEEEDGARKHDLVPADCFPAREADRMTLPVRLMDGGKSLDLTHWTDGSSRNDFKLYAGNRSAARIVQDMLMGTRERPRKGQKVGEVKTKGIRTLWEEDPAGLAAGPFDVLTPMRGSFNFDPRGAWTALDAGYSPNHQKHGIAASPVVELLAAIGLEHARPVMNEDFVVRYAVWGAQLAPPLARGALSGCGFGVSLRNFAFELDFSGKNKIVTLAEEELSS
jgi:CRISPR-associated protein Csb3